MASSPVAKRTRSTQTVLSIEDISPTRTVRYVGPVTRALNERVLAKVEKLVTETADEPIALFVTSTGGPTGSAMSFFDTMRYVLKPNLITIGSGDVDSSGVILFLSGDTRFVTARTTMLLHTAGRRFGPERHTAKDMEAMLMEDRMKDEQYALLVAERSRGMLSPEEVLSLMERNTVLTPNEMVAYGLATAVLA